MLRLLPVFCLLACAPELDEARLDTLVGMAGDAATGETTYQYKCQRCHGVGGVSSQPSRPSLAGKGYTPKAIGTAVLTGPGSMPHFSKLTDQELADVMAFVGGL